MLGDAAVLAGRRVARVMGCADLMNPECEEREMKTQGELMRRGAKVMMAGLLMGMFACEQPNWEDPVYVAKQLESTDANIRQLALEKVKSAKGDALKAHIPALVKLYLSGGATQKDAMTLLVQLRDPAAKDAYIAEVKSNATDYAAACSEALGDSGITEAIPEMLALLEKTDKPDVKIGLLQGMAKMPDAQMIPALVKLLELDPDNHPIALHSYACDILGLIGQKSQAAITPEAVQAVSRGVFLSNNKRQDVARECSLASQRIGKPMEPAFVAIYKGERADVDKLMMTYQFATNRSRGVASARLVSLRSPEAAALFIASLDGKRVAPEALKGEAKLSWTQTEAQVTHEEILGVGDLGAKDALSTLTKIAKGEREKDWELILDYATETQLRQDAVMALASLGDRSALPTLLALADKGVVSYLESRAVAMEKAGEPMAPIQRYTFNYTAAKAYALLSTSADAAAFDGFVAGIKSAELKAEIEKFKPALAVAAECGGKPDAAAQAACYGGKLNDKVAIVRDKAAYELMWLPAEAAGPVVAAALGNPNLDTRERLSYGAYRHAPKAAIAKIDEVLKAEEGQSDKRAAHHGMKMLRAWLVHNGK
jgi:HEAT repeat protein